MKNSDFLATLQKHIDSGVIEAVPSKITKAQIHNFGESMKGINEFIGAVQVLSANLGKIKNLSEKIEWINELLRNEKNENTITMLNMQKSTHSANIKYVVDGTKFIGVELFGTNLSCAVNGSTFSISVENPLNAGDMSGFCAQKISEIDALLKTLNYALNHNDAESSADSAMMERDISVEIMQRMKVLR